MAVPPPTWPEDVTPPPRKSIKIKIIIDGSHPKDVQVVNAETGELIKGVHGVRIEGRVGECLAPCLSPLPQGEKD